MIPLYLDGELLARKVKAVEWRETRAGHKMVAATLSPDGIVYLGPLQYLVLSRETGTVEPQVTEHWQVQNIWKILDYLPADPSFLVGLDIEVKVEIHEHEGKMFWNLNLVRLVQ